MSTIYVDLIEDEPLTRDGFAAEEDRCPNGFECEVCATAYAKYLDRFQPWRILVKSGDNQEPLFRSTESYFNRLDAIHAAQIAFGPRCNVYLREAEHGNVALRLAAE